MVNSIKYFKGSYNLKLEILKDITSSCISYYIDMNLVDLFLDSPRMPIFLKHNVLSLRCRKFIISCLFRPCFSDFTLIHLCNCLFFRKVLFINLNGKSSDILNAKYKLSNFPLKTQYVNLVNFL